jgi:RNA polymerase sigma factor (sigma-70 family)
MATGVAVGMVANEEVARDLVQEALLQAYLSLERLRDGRRFQSWLYGIVLNVCRSHLRDRKSNTLSLEDVAGGQRLPAAWAGAADPWELAEERELRRKVLEAVQALAPRDRYEIFVPRPFDPEAAAAIHAAREEARRFGESRVGTEHLLLAVLRQRRAAAHGCWGAWASSSTMLDRRRNRG